MAKEVIVTPEAERNYERITDYLVAEWGVLTANNFIERYDEIVIMLCENPGIFQFADITKRVQKCILTKHIILYFIETAETVKILTIFDTSQDPQKLSEFI
jgi:plasmid stabilization system protein ParE